jgi:hypothetical protein
MTPQLMLFVLWGGVVMLGALREWRERRADALLMLFIGTCLEGAAAALFVCFPQGN